MRILSLLVVLSFTSHLFYSQEIDFNRVSAGLTVKYLIPGGDMGDFWGRTPGAGLTIGYRLTNSTFLEGEILYSKFNPLKNTNEYPTIQLIGMSGGLKYQLAFLENWRLNIKSGIENSMFIFSGPAAEFIYEQNKNESEFGFFILSGLQYNIGSSIKIEVSFKVLSILSSPENINIFIPGLTLFIL